MDGEGGEEETYIQHLRLMFNELDTANNGGLNQEQMKTLSDKLSLQENQSVLLLQLSFGLQDSFTKSDENVVVDFNKFQECFVVVLSETTDLPMSYSDSEEELPDVEHDDKIGNVHENDATDEVKPCVVRGGRSYGRRSQPDLFDCEDETEQKKNDISGCASDVEDNVFENGFYELPERSNKIYFEASGQLPHPAITRLRQKSSANMSIESQNNLSTSSPIHQTQHYFSELDKDEVGFIDFSELCEVWKKEGIGDAEYVLQLLDISIDGEKQVNAYDLTSTLENEASSLRLSSLDSILKAVLATYKHQITHLNGQVEQQHILLGKMKEDLEKSEIRNTKLIDEVDDRYLNVDKSKEQILINAERQWSKKLRQTKKNFEKDRELFQAQVMRERDALQQEIDRLTIREGSLRSTIEALQLDNDALEQDTKDLVEKLQLSEKNASRLQKDLECLINEKTISSNDPFNASQEERFAAIIKDYEAQCRSLSDRNDELVTELEKVRSEFLQSMRRKTETEETSDEEMTSEGKSGSRKRARRHRSTLSEYIKNASSDESEEAALDEINSNLQKKISELELIIQEMKEERAKITSRFGEEKSILRSQLESELRSKVEEERKKLVSFQEMTKSDRNTAINQALADGRKQREELERKLSELEKSVDTERMNGQETISKLCREFESDKTEIQEKHDVNLRELQQRICDCQHDLEEEKKCHNITQQQLQTDRSQHRAALEAHSNTINQLQKNTKKIDFQEKEKEITELKTQLSATIINHETEKQKMSTEHAKELETLRNELHDKIDHILSDKRQQEKDYLCSELERLHDTVISEREDMQHRITELKKAFNIEAEELRALVEVEKNELRKQLGKETASLRQKLAEEAEKEMERKRQKLKEKEKSERDSQILHLEEIIKNLKEAKGDLEEQVAQSHAMQKNNDQKLKLQEVKNMRSEDDSISNLDMALNEKEKLIQVLQSKIEDLRKEQVEKSQQLLQTNIQFDARNAEILQLVKEKQDIMTKLSLMESERSSYQIDNARLNAKNIELGRIEAENHSERDEEIKELSAKLNAKDEICSQLREKVKNIPESDPPQNKITSSHNDLRSRHEETRNHLMMQMKKMKDMYSKIARSEAVIKDLYCENAQLMRALQMTEERQKTSERRNAVECDKNLALTSLLRKICPEAV